MEEIVNVLNYDVQLLKAKEFRLALENFCQSEHLQSMLFLSIPILVEAMDSKEYFERISRFQLLLPGEEDVLMMHPVKQYKERNLMMDVEYLNIILEYLSESQHTLYLVGDQYAKLQMFVEYCKSEYKDLQIVGSFVGDQRMDDDSLLNDINVTCPDVILTAIAPQLQENWILNNVDKLNGRVCIGADVLVCGLLERFIVAAEQQNHGILYNRCTELKHSLIGNIQRKVFRMDYEHYMKQMEMKRERG